MTSLSSRCETRPTGRVAAVMFPLAPGEEATLAAAMGGGWEVHEGRDVEAAAAVLVRPCSSQTVAAVRQRFPDACLIVMDSPLGSESRRLGPIRRAIDAGADLYLSEAGTDVPGAAPRAA